MSSPAEVTPIDALILAKLLVSNEKGPTEADLKKALEPLLGHRWAGAELIEQIARRLAGLEAAGLISRTRKGKTERSTLTDDGRRQALASLGLDHLPPKTTWSTLTKTYLPARALGLPTPQGSSAKAFGGDPGFKAALLKAEFGLPLDDFPKLDEAIEALTWTLLGFEPGRKFNAKLVQALVIRRALGELRVTDPKPDPKKEAAKLLAKAVGARQLGKDELRQAAIRRWVDGTAAEPAPARSDGALEPPPAATSLGLDAFAHRVLDAARSSPSGRFGDNKVFIAHVWQGLQADPAIAAMGLENFKHKLAEANHARLLNLSRADMVEAMNPDDVTRSEVAYQGATFHFIRL